MKTSPLDSFDIINATRIWNDEIFLYRQTDHGTLGRMGVAGFRIEPQRMRMLELQEAVLENEITFEYLLSINLEKSPLPPDLLRIHLSGIFVKRVDVSRQ